MSHPARSSKFRRLRRVLLATLLGIVVVLGTSAAVLLTPSPVEEAEVAAVRADPALRVVENDGYLALLPAEGSTGTGMIFYPGARTVAEAYLPSWAPIVKATGMAVYLAEMPFGFASLRDDAAGDIIAAEPSVGSWWIGGHSLGGITAARYADDHQDFEGLLLWAAFPEEEVVLVDIPGLEVLAVTGSRDEIVPTEVVRERLEQAGIPSDVVEIDGMEHSQFGSYRSIFGDGDPTISDAAARQSLAEATSGFLSSAR
ncbi:alpha/beta hydrolase [Arthrobacter sp. H20]|uniref:alpha/beta hydrolase n=1 Tax=Arthrobacter sp. H20 TaxID=1267981 RepID=UPI0009DD1296|nr:alpha/beta hydrolase [Arthrobacter sp. H20]